MKPRVEFDLNKIESNIKKMKEQIRNTNFLFPVKCCTHNSVLDLVYNNNFGFDVSNANEMSKNREYLDGSFVSVSGPLSYELANNNYDDLHIIANNLFSYNNNKGLRINFNSNLNLNIKRHYIY